MRIRFGVLTVILSSILAAGCYTLNPSDYVAPDGEVSLDGPATQGADVASPDAPMGGEGGGGSGGGIGGTGGTGGAGTGSGGPGGGGDAGVLDATGAQPDVPVGGSGGIASAIGGSTASTGGTTAGSGGVAGAGGTTTSGGSTAFGGSMGGVTRGSLPGGSNGGTGGTTGTGGASGTGAASTQDAGGSDAPIILDGTCAINGSPARAGTVCRVAAGVCDVPEICDGISAACPLDQFMPSTQVCRPSAGDCDELEACTGTSAACPPDQFLPKSAVCRPAVPGGCDVAEYCDGSHPACPADVIVPSTIPCRASTDGNVCDPTENCTGTSNTCPADVKYTRPAAPPADVAVAPGTLQADVSWTPVAEDTGDGLTRYNVKMLEGSWMVVGKPAAPPYTAAISAGPTFYFVVSAWTGLPMCESADSSPPVSVVSCVAVAPASLSAATDSAGKVTLTWTPPSGSVASYNVLRSTNTGGGYEVVASGLSVSATTYEDTPPVPASGIAAFYYVVRANTGDCNSPYSPQATAVVGLH